METKRVLALTLPAAFEQRDGRRDFFGGQWFQRMSSVRDGSAWGQRDEIGQ